MASAVPFLIRPENGKFLRGETQRLPGSPAPVLFLIPSLLIAGSLGCFCLAGGQWRQLQHFRQHAVTTRGTVLSKREHSSLGMPDLETGMISSDEDYLVKYRFEANTPAGPRTVEREASVGKADYDRWQAGDAATVTYDPEDLTSSHMDGEDQSAPQVALTVGGVLSLGGGMLLGVLLAACWWRDRCLTRDGTKLGGRLVNCTSSPRKDGGTLFEVQYQFVSPTGRVFVDRALISRDGGADLPPTPGSPVVILYHSDSCYQIL
jgi:hypothetical protein